MNQDNLMMFQPVLFLESR